MAKRLGLLVLGVTAWLTVAGSAQQPDRADVLILFHEPPGQAGRAIVEAAGGRIKYTYGVVPAIAANLPVQAITALSNNPRIDVIEPDGIATINDAELDNTWGVKRIGAGAAHEAEVLGTGVKVAVIDTGITYTHPDLSANYDGGWDFVNNDADPMDDQGHGTHVAGTIAAARNGVGVVGVAPGARLYAVKVLGANGSGSYSAIIAGIDWATANDMKVTNNSYGGTGYSATMELAFANAAAAGVVSVASAGNSGTCAGAGDSIGYPAKYSSVIAVGAIDDTDARACFSSTGPDLELAAPGVQINSTIKTGGYGSKWNGTSMASPHVAGVAALLLGRGVFDDNANGRFNDEVRNILAMSAQDLGGSGRDTLYGFGRVDVPSALAVPYVPLEGRIGSISYATVTGRGKDLVLTLTAVYGLVVPQPGATISLRLILNNAVYKSVTGTTNSNGSVSFTFKNAPAGTYRTEVNGISGAGLGWDSGTPTNSFVKSF